MKSPEHSVRKFQPGSLGLLAALGFLGHLLAARAQEFDPLVALANANGAVYINLRTQLLDSHPAPWDVPAATAHAWDAGLAAFVLNGWLGNRELFNSWDGVELSRKISGNFRRHPATGADQVGQTYLIEQIWKTALIPQWRDDALDSLLTQNVAGPLTLWHAVWANAPAGALKNLAAHALPNDPSNGTRNLLAGVLDDPAAAADTKQAILTGLAVVSPAYATRVLLRTLSSWEGNIDLAGHGLRALALQTDNLARPALHTIALDSQKSEALRLTAVVAFSDQPRAADVATLEALLASAAPAQLLERTALVLKVYPINQTRALLHTLLSAPPTLDVLYWAIIATERKGSAEDIPALTAVAQNPAIPEHLRQSAATAVQTIQRRENAP